MIDFLHKEETLSKDEIKSLQVKRLKETIRRAVRSKFYFEKFKDIDIERDINKLDDIRRLPFTTKSDLRSEYPIGFLTEPIKNIVRLHASSGTTGNPTVVFYTRKDLDTWADLVARCMYMVGIRPTDIFQNISGYGLFTGGLGIHYGAERLGCLTIPSATGNSKRQIKFMMDFKVTAIHIIPSYALYLISVFEDMNIDPKKDTYLRIFLIGAEPHSEEARRKIEDFYGVKAYNSYGLSEMNGPGVAFECQEQEGLHLWEDAYFLEIIDPKTLDPVKDGEVGELVLTSLKKEAMPIIRYRTGDLTRIIPEDCRCGRKHRRIDRIVGRSDDMIILKGVNIYPMQIERILMDLPEVGENYQIIIDNDGYQDRMRVKVEIRDEFFVEDMRVLKGLEKKIERRLKQEILVTPKVELVEHKSLPRSEGKAKRVIDLRK